MSGKAVSEPHDAFAVSLRCADGVVLGGHWWPARVPLAGNVVVNPATGAPARYYHRYARFLAGHGFNVLTYDYRGIGLSRPTRLCACGYRWRDWGMLDVDAAIRFADARREGAALIVVGHSIGGFLPGLAASAGRIDRMLTVGAQYAWWGDYAASRRAALFAKWHVAMPVATLLWGYFPGSRLGWLEDLPAGVALEWSFRGARFERSHPRAERPAILARMASVKAPILAVTVSDDEFGTPRAIRRTLDYYTGSPRAAVLLTPEQYGRSAIGHSGLFHDSHMSGFWTETLCWLGEGKNPWPGQGMQLEM